MSSQVDSRLPVSHEHQLARMSPSERERFFIDLGRIVENDATGVWQGYDDEMSSTSAMDDTPSAPPIIEQSIISSSPAVEVESDEQHTPDETVTDTELTPSFQQEVHSPLVMTFVDQTADAIAAARDAAEERRRNELQSGSRFRKFMKNLWMGENGLAGNYYMEKYKKEALAGIGAKNDIFAHKVSDDKARHDAQMATIERFQSEYNEMIHGEAGEKRAELDDTSPTSKVVKDLVRSYVNGNISDVDALHEELQRELQQLNYDGNEEIKATSVVRLDNMVEIADQVKAMVGHGESLDHVLSDVKIVTGESSANVRSEAHLSRVEHTIDRLHQSKVGQLVSPESLGVAASVAVFATRLGRGSLARALMVTGAGAVMTSAAAGGRENLRVKQERALHSREMAQGEWYGYGARRDSMELTRYETIGARELTDGLNQLLDRSKGDTELTPDQVQAAYEAIAAVEARVRLSDARKIDLISYSSAFKIESERRDLDEARAKAKTRLAPCLHDLPEEYRNRFAINDDASVDQALARCVSPVVELENDIDAKDEAFSKMRRRRVVKAMALAGAASFVSSIVAQEVAGLVSPSYDSLMEHVSHPSGLHSNADQSVLESLSHDKTSESVVHTMSPSSQYSAYALGSNHGVLEVPSGYHAITDQGGNITIEGPNGTHLADNLTTDSSGNFTQQSIDTLQQKGVTINDTGGFVSSTKDVPTTLTVQQYNQSHAADLVHVTRDAWYDNNTTVPDKNELGIQWSGTDNNGVGPDGSIQMSVSHMAEGSSRQVSWAQDAAQGHLKLAVSASPDTQAQVYMVDVKPDGTIDIPADSPVAKFFSPDASGHMQFHGAYAEVASINSVASGDNITHISPLATITGDSSVKTITENVPTQIKTYVPHFKLTPPVDSDKIISSRTSNGFIMPVFVPRRPLERLRGSIRERRVSSSGYDSYSVSRDLSQEKRRLENEFSPQLRADPQARIQLEDGLNWHHDFIYRKGGEEYAHDVEQAAQSSSELQQIGDKIKAIITIPVGAEQESDNIYRTLSLYGRQDASKESYMILLHVNWIDSAMNDPVRKAEVEKTLREIKRAKNDYPELKVSIINSVWSQDKIDKHEYGDRLIGHVSQKMYDVAMVAAQRAMQAGRIDKTNDMLVIKNDADAQGMDKAYVSKMIRAFEMHPDKDVFTGAIYWGAEGHADMPGFGFVSMFREVARTVAHLNGTNGDTDTFGVNAAVRMSTLAAIGGIGHYSDQSHSVPDDLAIGERVKAARYARDGLSWPVYGGERSGDQSDHHFYVVGAAIDTDAERMEAAYAAGRTIVGTWAAGNATNENGVMRSRGSEGLAHNKEDVEHALGRIEDNISAMITHWFTNRRQVATTLAFMVPDPRCYQIVDVGGTSQFRFTKQGQSWMTTVLGRDDNPYGERITRRLYGNGKRMLQGVR